MGNTYNYLTTVIRDLKEGFKTSPSLFLITLVLLTIPLNYAVNSIALGVYFGMTLLGIRKNTFKIDNNLLLPIMLFVLMAVSLIWTHDMSSSLKALSKSLPLLVVPICFFITSPLNKEEKEILIKNFSYGMLFFSLNLSLLYD